MFGNAQSIFKHFTRFICQTVESLKDSFLNLKLSAKYWIFYLYFRSHNQSKTILSILSSDNHRLGFMWLVLLGEISICSRKIFLQILEILLVWNNCGFMSFLRSYCFTYVSIDKNIYLFCIFLKIEKKIFNFICIYQIFYLLFTSFKIYLLKKKKNSF